MSSLIWVCVSLTFLSGCTSMNILSSEKYEHKERGGGQMERHENKVMIICFMQTEGIKEVRFI